ncbi:hypothetical protein SAMN04487857_101220 [Pseudomonas sp. ok272]|nr:hypothetical protein SAMN04487857_101220 [Pseudomonas sp. ok272]SFM33835.1 hypothetical protein SAMN04487858_102222 [Pseudomonas sp. ok602]
MNEALACGGDRLVVLVDSDLDRVFAYLDDPANSDVFVEAARYQRPLKTQ